MLILSGTLLVLVLLKSIGPTLSPSRASTPQPFRSSNITHMQYGTAMIYPTAHLTKYPFRAFSEPISKSTHDRARQLASIPTTRVLVTLWKTGQYWFQMACLWSTNQINSRTSRSRYQALYLAYNQPGPP